jgi:hypothetical protein
VNVFLISLPSSISEIENLDPTNPRTLKELTNGHGGLCGSVYIDENMRRLLRSKLRRYIRSIPACAMEMMMDEFVQTVKVKINTVHFGLIKRKIDICV